MASAKMQSAQMKQVCCDLGILFLVRDMRHNTKLQFTFQKYTTLFHVQPDCLVLHYSVFCVFSIFCKEFNFNINRAFLGISVLYRQNISSKPSSTIQSQFFLKRINHSIFTILFTVHSSGSTRSSSLILNPQQKLCLISPVIVHSFYKIYFCLQC